jgi:hypothetical protein
MDDFKKARAGSGGLASELGYFLRKSGKWWLLPVLAAFVVLGALMLLSSSAAAPFIYTLF